MEDKVLITGASGATGRYTIQNLLAQKVPVRAMFRKASEETAALAAQGVEIVMGNLLEFNDVSAALKGISKAYFVYPVTVPGLLEATVYFAQAAVEEKLQVVVNMSQRTSRRDSQSHGAQNHWIAERLLDRTGIPVVHLQPTLFDEWLEYFAQEIRTNSRIMSPFENAAYAQIAAEDLGRVIATILVNPDAHIGKTYPLYGPEELTQYQVADILSEVLGRKITYLPMEIDAYSTLLAKFFTPYFVQHVGGIALDFRSGVAKGTNNLVAEITGTAPLHIKDYVRKHLDLFK